MQTKQKMARACAIVLATGAILAGATAAFAGQSTTISHSVIRNVSSSTATSDLPSGTYYDQ